MTSRTLIQRSNHVLLVVWRRFKSIFRLRWNVWIFFGRLQCAVNLSEIGFTEIGFCIVRWPEVCKATSLGQETDVVTGVDIIGGVSYQRDGVPFVGQSAQEEHHLAIQARIKARCRLVQEKDAWIRQQFQRD